MQAFSKLHNDDLGKLILRLTIGGLMLFHGFAKLSHFSAAIEGIGGGLQAKGLPTFIAYGVIIGEVLAPLLIVSGTFTRPAALVLMFNMIVAVWLVHSADIFTLHPKTGGWSIELQAFYFFGALAIVFLGSGKYSLSRGNDPLD